MKRRLTTAATAALAALLAIVLLPLVGPVAPAGAAEEDFTLSMTSGELLIRDADEAFPIGLPTTISGVNTEGQLSNVAFTTPTISFVQDVPAYGTQAFIDASFSMVEPGSGTLNEEGDVVMNISLTVDLHIVVPILAFPSDCRATPVHLTLTSSTPYDGDSVTLTAPNFSVPNVAESPECSNLVGDAVNDALSGPGHSLSMTLSGGLTLPVAGEPTVTALTIEPETGARVGQEVTLTASVEPAEEPEDEEPVELAGSVTFFDGAVVLGTAALEADGEASLTTAALSAGTRQLRAVYSGSPPDWRPSSSLVTPYVVSAAPLVSTDLAGGVVIGGGAKDFTVSVRNTGLGAVLEDVRLDVRIFRLLVGSGQSLATVTLDRVVDVDEDIVAPVALTGTGGSPTNQRRGSIVSEAWSVLPGQTVTETLRLTVPAGVGPGEVQVGFELVTMEDEADVVLSSASSTVLLTGTERFPTEITAGTASIPPVTPVVRQGTILEVRGLTVGPRVSNEALRGTLSFSIGGRPVLARENSQNALVPWSAQAPLLFAAGLSYHLVVPEDMALGTHLVQVRYSGDDLYAGSVATWPATIEPGRGDMYDCASVGATQRRFVANINAWALIPPVGVRGGELVVERIEAQMYMSRTQSHAANLSAVVAQATADRTFELTGGVTGAFTTFAQSGNSAMNAATTPPAGPVDWQVNLGGGTGSLPVAHDAGTVLAIGLESIVIRSTNILNLLTTISCRPFGETTSSIASVTSTGTSLTVDPAEAVRQGEAVELTAEALPISPGVVEFLDGDNTVGVAPVDGFGIARVTVDDLPPGVRTLTARYFGTVFPDSTSEAVELTVEGIDCIDFAEPGSEAVVRLIYLTVLNRCPDQAGFDFWVERLDGGATRESVANAIAASHEARKVLVDEAYELMLERTADAEGKEFWATRLGQTGSYRDLIGHLGSSPEFRTLAGGTDAGVVARLYDRLLHRTPSAEDSAFWVGQIQARGVRATVIRMFDLDEPLRTLVGDTYRTIVDRAPTLAESDAGVALMRARSDRAALNASVINTNDFYTRAQDFPNRD